MPPKTLAELALFRQEDFLYRLEWGEKVDNMFVEVLSDQALMGTFQRDDADNILAITTAMLVVNKFFKKTFDMRTCCRQAHKLRKHHRVFSWLLSLDGLHYDASTNHIHAASSIWRSIVKVEVFANAYESYGDPCWKWLKILFGTPPIVPPQPVPINVVCDVVDIPSDDENEGPDVGAELIVFPNVESSSLSTNETDYWNN